MSCFLPCLLTLALTQEPESQPIELVRPLGGAGTLVFGEVDEPVAFWVSVVGYEHVPPIPVTVEEWVAYTDVFRDISLVVDEGEMFVDALRRVLEVRRACGRSS